MNRLAQSRSLRLFASAAGFGLVWVFLWSSRLRWAGAEEAFWMAALFSLCCLPALLFIAGQEFQIPLLPMWGLGYFAMFGMPLLNAEQPHVQLSSVQAEAVVDSLRLIAGGAALLLVMAYTPAGHWVEQLVPQWRLPWDMRRASKVGVLLVLFGLWATYYRITSPPSPGLAQLLSIASQLSVIGTLTMFLLTLRRELRPGLKLFLWGIAVPFQVLLGLGTGAIWEVIRSMTPILFCYAAERRRIPWKWLVILALLVIPFQGTKAEYRSYAWSGEVAEDVQIAASPIRRGFAFMTLTYLRLKEGGVETYTVAAETTEARVNHFELLMAVREMTPSLVPFWNGETYATLPWMLVPRLLFPQKPTKTLGQEFGHRYGLLHEEDVFTSYNLPHQVVEMYINFGVAGVLIGMALMGLLYRALLALLSRPEAGERGLIIGCTMLGNLLSLDSDFSLVFGGLAYYILLMLFFTRFLQPRPEPG